MSIPNFKRIVKNSHPAIKVNNNGPSSVKVSVGNNASYVTVRPNNNRPGHLNISAIATDPNYEGKGLAGYITALVVRAAKNAGFKSAGGMSIHITFNKNNENRARKSIWPISSYIFSRLGFQKLLVQGKPGVYKVTNANRHRVTWNINLDKNIPKVNEKLRGNNKLIGK
jgi:ribosomal protein S18 acetylase RimI-like enzyme